MGQQPVKVLLVDDDEDDYLLTREHLSEIGGVALDWKSSYDEGIKAICEGEYDLCLLDYRLGVRTGLDLLKEAKEQHCHLPIILLTGQGEREIDVQAMELGAADFIEKKSLTPARLDRAIRYSLRKQRKEEQLENLIRARTRDLDEAHQSLRSEMKVRQETDAALRESEQRFRHLADAMPQIVWISDPEGTIEYINRQWTLITGKSLEDTRDPSKINEVIHPEDQPRVQEVWLKSRQLQVAYQVQMRVRHAASNEYRWYLTRGVPVLDDQGRLIKWYGTSTDINEQKALEVEQRETNRRKDAFLAGLAHELRNPLPPIRNALEIMRLSGDNVTAVERGRVMIERQVNHLIRLIDGLLDLSRLTRGKIRLHVEKIDLCNIVHDAVEATRPLIESAGHHLSVDSPREPVVFEGDATRLTQAVVNLLNNAAKFTDAKGDIRLTARQEDDHILISVKDNGVGIAKDRVKHIFDAFGQGDATQSRAQGGLGIGLALVKGTASLHGGSVEAHSEGPGKGSEFVLRLPVSPPVIEASASH
jgi:PAS domain S-box-containing protein